MPTIHVELFAGRTIEQKRALAHALTAATVQTLGGSAAGIDVIFTEVQRHDWATGGQLWSDAATPHPATAATSARAAGRGTARDAARVVAPAAAPRTRKTPSSKT